jgi:catechol 2,3-dioxygenase-like lactoylglutathione lyase family enzyme
MPVTLSMKIRRIIMFTGRMDAMTAFYRDVLGLELKVNEKGWKEFDAGAIVIALHNGTSEVGRRPPKLVFYSNDVAGTRETLMERGAKMGKVKSGAGLDLCEGTDPDGNPFQVSNRP